MQKTLSHGLHINFAYCALALFGILLVMAICVDFPISAMRGSYLFFAFLRFITWLLRRVCSIYILLT